MIPTSTTPDNNASLSDRFSSIFQWLRRPENISGLFFVAVIGWTFLTPGRSHRAKPTDFFDVLIALFFMGLCASGLFCKQASAEEQKAATSPTVKL